MRLFKRKKDFEAGVRLEREVEAATMLPNTRFGWGAATFLTGAFLLTIYFMAVPRWQARLQGKDTLESDPLEKARPYTQLVLTKATGSNNAQVVAGHDNWLFYQLGVAHVTGPAFLDPQILKSARHQPKPRFADPRTVILNFRAQLRERGIELMLMPIPDKAAIYPDKLLPNYDLTLGPPKNASFEAFKADMKAKGIPLYDPTDLLWETRQKTAEPLYLATDTHWTPKGIEVCSKGLAKRLREIYQGLPPIPAPGYRTSESQIDAPGDLVRLMGLPDDQKIYQLGKLPVRVVHKPQGGLYLPDINSDVLLLGDSYAGSYEPGGGGLAAELTYELQHPVDSVTKSNGGSWGARFLLKDKMLGAKGQKKADHLRGKKLLIWEFASRDLSSGDWIPSELPKPEPLPAVNANPAR